MKTAEKEKLTGGLVFEERDCPGCSYPAFGHPMNEEFAKVTPPLGEECVYVKCGRCGVVYMNPAPTGESLEAFYRDVYCTPEYRRLDGYAMPEPEREFQAALSLWEKRMDLIVQMKPGFPQDLFDVGCGYGGLLDAARDARWQVAGCEASEVAVKFIREKLRINTVLNQSFPDDRLADCVKADVVTMFEFIEHVADPRAAVACAARMLKEDGLLVMTFPDATAPDTASRENRPSDRGTRNISPDESWIGWRPATHLQFFGMKQIAGLMEGAGLSAEAFFNGGGYAGQRLAVGRKI